MAEAEAGLSRMLRLVLVLVMEAPLVLTIALVDSKAIVGVSLSLSVPILLVLAYLGLTYLHRLHCCQCLSSTGSALSRMCYHETICNYGVLFWQTI